jgi:hypothetical protein
MSDLQRQKVYAVFSTACFSCQEGSQEQLRYEAYLQQLQILFGTDKSSYNHIISSEAAERLEIEILLDDLAAA